MSIWLYILSISLQVSGALLLMKYSLSTHRKQVIKRFINKNIIIKDFDGKINYDKDELKETFKISYLNKFSFAFIALGYLINIFGDIDNSYLPAIFIGIIIFTMLFMLLAYFIVFIIIKYSKKVNRNLTEEEMLEYKIYPNLSSTSKNDIDEMF